MFNFLLLFHQATQSQPRSNRSSKLDPDQLSDQLPKTIRRYSIQPERLWMIASSFPAHRDCKDFLKHAEEAYTIIRDSMEG